MFVLNYGVILTGGTFKSWQRACINELENVGFARLQCIVSPDPTRSDLESERFLRRYALPSQAAAELPQAPVTLSGSNWQEELPALNLHFLLHFGDRDSGLDLRDAAKYGVWYFAHSDLARFSTPAPGFWEIYFGHDVTAAMLLQISDAGEAGVVLKSGYFPTIRYSLEQNIEAPFAALTRWPARVCHDIAHGAAGCFNDAPIPVAPVRCTVPDVVDELVLAAREAGTSIGRYFETRFFTIDWSLGVLNGSPSDFIDRSAKASVTDIYPHANGRYLADPFVVVRNGKTYVFCEEFPYDTSRGFLSVLELPMQGSQPQTVMKAPYHLSYPQIFEYNGELYCIPESIQPRNVSLYRSVTFPNEWEYCRTLIEDFDASDSTLVKFENKWWLFCTSGATFHRGYNSHLYIWYADDLFGEWTPHPQNPVKIDARSARPAGPFFLHDGRLYRPAQDCSRTYGGAICINRIEKLTVLDFKERVVGVIRPPDGSYDKGIHTISSAGDCCIADVKRVVFRPSGVVDALKEAAKTLLLRSGVPEEKNAGLKSRLRQTPGRVPTAK